MPSARDFIARSIRAAKIIAQDGRIPRPLRWLAALALLPIPGPFDEAVLLIVALLMFVFYRRPMREAWHAAKPQDGASATCRRPPRET